MRDPRAVEDVPHRFPRGSGADDPAGGADPRRTRAADAGDDSPVPDPARCDEDSRGDRKAAELTPLLEEGLYVAGVHVAEVDVIATNGRHLDAVVDAAHGRTGVVLHRADREVRGK